MKEILGVPHNFENSFIGKLTHKLNLFKRNQILFCDKKPLIEKGLVAYIVPKGKTFKTLLPVIEIEGKLPFENGDVLSVNKSGKINVVWENNSCHNALYVTDACNSKCIMCPQIEGSKSHYDECLTILDIVDLKKHKSIGITGGEPTINIDKLVRILEKIAEKSPNCSVHILTNGRNFSKIENVKKLVSIKGVNISYGIPLYSGIAEDHDYIVGVQGAFVETIRGLYNLAQFKQDIEIRVVILRQNYERLEGIANYIYRNLPFVSHVALMGMEYHGNAETNYDIVSVDPVQYKQNLFNAVRYFVRYNMLVDIYNLPYCLTDKRIRQFCRDSISTWKKTYLPQCKKCSVKDGCSGVFETSFIHSANIKPITVSKKKVIHKKPVEDTPTSILVEYIEDVTNSTQDGDVILDLACGYGRNAKFIAKKGLKVIGIDNSYESLEYINGLCLENIETKNINLSECTKLEDLPTVSAIINVHYYTDELLTLMIKTLKKGGILVMETINGRGGNHLNLPKKNYVKDELIKHNFRIIKYEEKTVKPYKDNKVSVKVVAKKEYF